jgi:aspartate kinase
VTAAVFEEVAGRGILVDDIVQTPADPGRTTLAFTVEDREPGEVRTVGELLAQRFDARTTAVDEDLVRVSIIGVGMRSHSGVAARMFSALAGARINIEGISTSEIVVSVLVRAADGERALHVVHQEFGLDRPTTA